MFKLKMIGVAVLAAVTFISAAEAEKKAEKAADEKKITPYGMAQYRLRGNVIAYKNDSLDVDSSVTQYEHKIAYHLGVNAKLNDKVSAALQVGNKSVATETAKFNSTLEESIKPFFHLAYAKLDPGYLNFSFGIIPQKNFGPLDLIERSLAASDLNDFSKVSYKKASMVSWAVGTENSMPGLALGLPILKKDVKLAVNLSTSVIDSYSDTPSRTKMMFVADVPFSASILSITPQFAFLANRIAVEDENGSYKKDHEIAVGGKVGLKVNKNISFSTDVGFAAISNKNSKEVTSDTLMTHRGFYYGFGGSIKAGPGKFNFAYKMSTDNVQYGDGGADLDDSDDIDANKWVYHYIDVKYGIGIAKYITVMPRFRAYFDRSKDEAVNKVTTIRPELIFIGKF